MSTRHRLAVVVLLSGIGLAAGASESASPPWDEPFHPDTAAVVAAASELEPAEEGVRILLEEERVRFREGGGREVARRLVYRIDSRSSVDSWGQVRTKWQPWYQERPEVRARVIAADGEERWLDETTIADEPVERTSRLILSDARVLRAALPGVDVGAVIETSVVTRETVRLAGAGVADRFAFGFRIPTAVSRLVLDVPQSLPFVWRGELVEDEPLRRTAGDREVLTFEATDLPWDVPDEPYLPPDVPRHPAVGYATGTSWSAVAAAYAEIVDRQIAAADLGEVVEAAVAGAQSRLDEVDALLARLHGDVRYTGLEFGEAAIVPRTPARVLERGYGDCKDKAALLVAMLRRAGIPAHVALLTTDPRRDAVPELPGFGFFNHAIVHVPAGSAGEPELWIDATATYHPAGLLPSESQGRSALIARSGEGGLVTTPASTAAENRFVDRRRVELAEIGPARVHGELELTGMEAARLRAVLSELPAEKVAEVVERFAAQLYGGELTHWRLEGLDDLRRPLRVVTESRDVENARTELAEAGMHITLGTVLDDLPDALREPPPVDGEESDEGRRHHDLVLPVPYKAETEIRVSPPDGYRLQEPPEPLDVEFGPARLTFRSEPSEDATVTLVRRFDTGPRRYTPQQVEATWQAIAEWEEWEATSRELPVLFENVGEAHLVAGRIGEAITEFRRLVTAHPDSAIQHTRLARALLAAGLGAQARRVARQALELAPESDLAHQELGWALLHDVVGRQMSDGWDREGAERALRRARELEPANDLVRRNLAVLLEHDSSANRYSADADLEAAIAEYRALRDEVDDHSMDTNLLILLYRTGRYGEARELAREMPGTLVGDVFLLAATAAEEGVAPALRTIRHRREEQERLQVLVEAGNLLVIRRHYEQAADLVSSAARGASDGAASLLSMAEQLRKVRPYEELEESWEEEEAAGPEGAVRRFLLALMTGDEEALGDRAGELGLDGKTLERLDLESLRAYQRRLHLVNDTGYPGRVDVDLALSGLEIQRQDEAPTGLHLVVEIDGAPWDWYLGAAEGGGWELVAALDFPKLGQLARLAGKAAETLEAGRPEAAAHWLDWVRDLLPPPSEPEPVDDLAFLHLWARDGGRDGVAARRAAASLRVFAAGEAEADRAVQDLERERAAAGAAGDPEVVAFLDCAISDGLMYRDRYDEAVPVLQRLAAARPDSVDAFRALSAALRETGRREALDAALDERLQRRPDGEATLFGGVMLAKLDGDLEEELAWMRRMVETNRTEPWTFNQIAWYEVALGEVDAETLETAHRAVEESGGLDSAELHTLATVYAELDRPLEARDVLHQAISLSGAPASHDWYVVGRIAESYDEIEAALEAYGKVEASPEDEDEPAATHHLARRRARALAAAD